MKIYMVFWSDTFDAWKMEKAFDDEMKARDYIESVKGNRWLEEIQVE